jgi:hypothetical protein
MRRSNRAWGFTEAAVKSGRYGRRGTARRVKSGWLPHRRSSDPRSSDLGSLLQQSDNALALTVPIPRQLEKLTKRFQNLFLIFDRGALNLNPSLVSLNGSALGSACELKNLTLSLKAFSLLHHAVGAEEKQRAHRPPTDQCTHLEPPKHSTPNTFNELSKFPAIRREYAIGCRMKVPEIRVATASSPDGRPRRYRNRGRPSVAALRGTRGLEHVRWERAVSSRHRNAGSRWSATPVSRRRCRWAATHRNWE